MRTLMTVLRYAWASPTTAIGLAAVVVTLATRGRCAVVDGVIEAHGGFAAWFLRRIVPLKGGANAITLGHIVLGRDRASLEATRIHERVHVRQCEKWGPLFIPAYFVECGLALLRGGRAYEDNRFEVEAYRASDGRDS